MRSLFLKRAIDLSLATLGLLLFSPLFLLVALLVYLVDGRPIFFAQTRPGLNGKPFILLKFRTMTNDRDASGQLLHPSKRITPLGRLLRSTSIDELPQLWNVLRGDMSLVGPRPLRMEYLDRYSEEQRRRHDVLPGITGWSQVKGRNLLSWDDRLRLDIWYVDNWTLGLDLKILVLTIVQVLRRKGIYSPSGDIVEQFQGTTAESDQ